MATKHFAHRFRNSFNERWRTSKEEEKEKKNVLKAEIAVLRSKTKLEFPFEKAHLFVDRCHHLQMLYRFLKNHAKNGIFIDEILCNKI